MTHEVPENTGDVYLLLDYPAMGLGTLAYAYKGPGDEDWRWQWWLDAEDGDQFLFSDLPAGAPCSRVVLVRRADEGILNHLAHRAPELDLTGGYRVRHKAGGLHIGSWVVNDDAR